MSAAGCISAQWNGALTGSGGVTKVGTGTWELGGINTYAGATQVQAGVLRVWVSTGAEHGRDPRYVSWHQDSAYFGLDPHEEVTAWVGFTDSTIERGCLKVMPRTHLGPIFPGEHDHVVLGHARGVALLAAARCGLGVHEYAPQAVKKALVGTGRAARFRDPFGIAVDSASNIYVADTGNSTIRKVTPEGVVTTFAGTAGVAGSASRAASACPA